MIRDATFMSDKGVMSDKAQAEQIESALTPIADMKGDIGFCRLGPHPDLCSAANDVHGCTTFYDCVVVRPGTDIRGTRFME